MQFTAIFVSKPELDSVMSLITGGEKGESYLECDRLALKYGLPLYGEEHYGITRKGELIAPIPPRSIPAGRQLDELLTSNNPALNWILGR